MTMSLQLIENEKCEKPKEIDKMTLLRFLDYM